MAETQVHEWLVDGIRMKGEVDEGGAIVVTSPDFREIVTQGDTVEEAQAMSRDALQLIVDWYKDEGKPLPDTYKPEVVQS